MGILIYAILAGGLGCWFGFKSRSGLHMPGLHFAVGYATIILALFFAQPVLGVSGLVTFWCLCILSAGGIIFRLKVAGWPKNFPALCLHPVWLLLAAGGAAVIANGGVDYLPVTHDEFSHWLGNPIKINAFGSWVSARESLHLADYPPGWPLLLALPWQMSGNVDLGAASTAPFVFHVAAIGVVFDLAVFLVRKHLNASDRQCIAAGWAFILLFMAAETLGPLWPRTLLIEPPQFLGYTIVLLAVFAGGVATQDRRTLEFYAGLTLASCYLIKSAAMIFVPAIIGVFLLRLLLQTDAPNRIRDALLSSTLVVLPVVVVAMIWAGISNGTGCLYSPMDTLSPEALARAGSLDWRDLATRYTGALWDYISSYKAPLTIAAAIGVGAGLLRGNYLAPVAFGLMSIAYLGLLYWYHLSCFGDYYFEHLNSIQRFTRVLLRTLHGVGLVLLLDAALRGFSRFNDNRECPAKVPVAIVSAGLFAGIAVLGAWQIYSVYRSVDIVTARTGQTVDFRVDEMRRAAARIEELKTGSLPEDPVLQIASQGMDSAVIDYARFFALGRQRGTTSARFKVAGSHSWAPKPVNTWQTRASQEDVRRIFEKADIIWPTTLDPWLRSVFAGLVDEDCLRTLPEKALIRTVPAPGKIRFVCIDKSAGS